MSIYSSHISPLNYVNPEKVRHLFGAMIVKKVRILGQAVLYGPSYQVDHQLLQRVEACVSDCTSQVAKVRKANFGQSMSILRCHMGKQYSKITRY